MRGARFWVRILVCLAASARAETPAGIYAIGIPADLGLVAPNGDSELCEVADGTEICLSASVAADVSGAVGGEGALTLEGELEGELALEIVGRVGGTTEKPKTKLELTVAGSVTAPEGALDVEGHGRMSCKLDPDAVEAMRCKGRVKLCAFLASRRVDCERVPFDLPLEFEREPFVLSLALATAQNGAVSGEAILAIGGVAAGGSSVAGKYKSAADTSNLKLTSTTPGADTKIRLRKLGLAAGQATGGTMKFKIAGQKGVVTLPAALPATPMAIPGTTFPGHGTCIRGGFCDVSQDTSALFVNPLPVAVRFDDTVFSGILGATTRLRDAAR